MILFKNVYAGKKVLVTGNTGFKGSWLSIWLLEMGAKVYGLSNGVPTIPSNFEVSHLKDEITYVKVDICDYKKVHDALAEIKPDFIFHLAAQAIVKDSYIDPINTLQVNVMGTANILEALRVLNNKCTAVMITSDKCYDNVEWVWGYKETDSLGGKDPYSASKGGAELVIKTYAESYFKNKSASVKIASARAGNVIGGGDWASHRIIPDAVRSWSMNEELIIRSPNATRPWQHVLEPLSGYLLLGQQLHEDEVLCGESFNFGPRPDTNFSVNQLLTEMAKHWPDVKWKSIEEETHSKEAGLLKLNCDKALFYINWIPNLSFVDTIRMVSEWYKEFYRNTGASMLTTTKKQIMEYVAIAQNNKLIWTI
jgi:CDP-glucose 4,6-dehydratase